MTSRILFLTSNGVGLGHLTRGMAIARRLPAGVEPVFLTLSQALPVVRAQGFYGEYLFSAGYADTDRRGWNRLYERRITSAIRTYEPSVVMFDGTYPYRGMLEALDSHPHLPFVWCRRALWRPGIGDRNVDWAPLFAAVLEPGEFAAAADAGATAARRQEATIVEPILLCDDDELAERAAACAEVGLDADGVNVLVQLGAGTINDITSDVGAIVERLRAHPRVTVVVAESTLAEDPPPLPDDVVRLRRYPLAPVLRAFDVVVTAAGYNSFHEVVGYGIPALLVPNTDTQVDDQLARARYAEQAGVARMWHPEPAADHPPGATRGDLAALDEALGDLLDDERRAELARTATALARPNGAQAAADLLAALAGGVAPAVAASAASAAPRQASAGEVRP